MKRGAWRRIALRSGCLLILLVTVTATWATWDQRSRGAKMEADWRKLLDGQSFPEAFPDRPDSTAARTLARRARQLGIATFRSGWKLTPPSQGAEQRWRELADELNPFLHGLEQARSRGDWPAVPGTRYLDAAEPILRALRDQLRSGEPLSWRRDLTPVDPSYPAPDSTAVLSLVKILVASTARKIERGAEDEAEADLDAIWLLTGSLRVEPYLISHVVDTVAVKRHLALLRGMCRPAPAWEHRLAALDMRRSSRIALEFEAFYLWSLGHSDLPMDDWLSPEGPVPEWLRHRLWLRPAMRWALRDRALASHQHLGRLEGSDLLALKPSVDCYSFGRRTPRWQLALEIDALCGTEVYTRALYRTLETELTVHVLAERRAPPAFDGSEPSPSLPGLRWLREEGPEGTTLRADLRLPFKGEDDPPLEYTVAVRDCPGSSPL